jgi:hypothetical protein
MYSREHSGGIKNNQCAFVLSLMAECGINNAVRFVYVSPVERAKRFAPNLHGLMVDANKQGVAVVQLEENPLLLCNVSDVQQ